MFVESIHHIFVFVHLNKRYSLLQILKFMLNSFLLFPLVLRDSFLTYLKEKEEIYLYVLGLNNDIKIIFYI
jgi:hypothetical protein